MLKRVWYDLNSTFFRELRVDEGLYLGLYKVEPYIVDF